MKINFVKSARKDNPAAKKGESYYWWKPFRANVRYSKSEPRRSQYETTKLAAVFGALESIEGLNLEGIKEQLEAAAEQVREVAEEYNESIQNVEDQFGESERTEEWREKAEACETLADTIDERATEIEAIDFDFDFEF